MINIAINKHSLDWNSKEGWSTGQIKCTITWRGIIGEKAKRSGKEL